MTALLNKNLAKNKILIIGAGPAGLAAAYKLSQEPNTEVIIWEKCSLVGGLAKTIKYQDFSFDLGPHRFFSKNQEVNDFWEKILPLQGQPSLEDLKWHKNNELSKKPGAPNPEKTDRVMLSKNRFTRMLFDNVFFDYPLKIDVKNIKKLGLIRGAVIILSYLQAKIKPKKPELNLEDFYINRFGKKLYQLFFKDYTKKVWGLPCQNIPKKWGAQRVKDLSLLKMLSNTFSFKNNNERESLIDKFKYPKYGAGYFYETLADDLLKAGVKIELELDLTKLIHKDKQIHSAIGLNKSKQEIVIDGLTAVISTMPISELINSLSPTAPKIIEDIAKELPYRNSIIIAMLYNKLKIKNEILNSTRANIIPDQWLYIQESSVKLGRISLFNNFSEFMLANRDLPWMSLEYFCNDTDEIWQKNDAYLIAYAQQELEKIGLAETNDFLTAKVVKVEKSYPAYFGSYDKFPIIKEYLNSFKNLFPAGRNGQHKYNNMDHSIASGFKAARIILKEETDQTSLWSINTENKYHEKK